MLWGWEGNRRSGVTLAMRHSGLGKGYEHPTNALQWSTAIYLITCQSDSMAPYKNCTVIMQKIDLHENTLLCKSQNGIICNIKKWNATLLIRFYRYLTAYFKTTSLTVCSPCFCVVWYCRTILMQLAGFILLVTGMMIYNNLVYRPFLIQHNCLSGDPPAPYNRMFINHPAGKIMHFVTLWPWHFWPNINWWARTFDGLSPCQVSWFY